MNYINARAAAEKWGISLQTVIKYCQLGLVDGVEKDGRAWKIPENSVIHLKKNHNKKSFFTYIDLFCGIGGFHQAMDSLGGKCVFACDINQNCREVYIKNYCSENEFPVYGDIVEAINEKVIPKFDVLCGGFPCQTFSKAGLQNGFNIVEDEHGKKDERGQLFYRIIDILEEHDECEYLILENVRNLADKKENWKVICSELKRLGFVITEDPIIASPHNFGIPQVRDRVFILGVRSSLLDGRKKLPEGYITSSVLNIDNYKKPISKKYNCLKTILDNDVDEKYNISSDLEEMLLCWEDFHKNVKGLVSPFWIHKAGIGICNREDYLVDSEIGFPDMPKWKQSLVMKSRRVYENNMAFIDDWITRNKMRSRVLIHQKFEWNAGDDCKSIKDGIIQIRQSGVRIKRPNYFPSLVVMNNTPIIWDEQKQHFRFITPKEAAKLQSFSKNFIFADKDSISYEQLGNSVNVELVRIFAKELFKLGKGNWVVSQEGEKNDKEDKYSSNNKCICNI